MDQTISKLSLANQAKTQKFFLNLSYMQSLDYVARMYGYKNYQHFRATKKRHIAFFSLKGGVGKSTLSRTIAKDINADLYLRIAKLPIHSIHQNEFIQIYPKIKISRKIELEQTKLIIYDIDRDTSLDKIQNILKEVDLFIIPFNSNETYGPYLATMKSNVSLLEKFNTKILLLSLKNNTKYSCTQFKEYFSQNKNIHFSSLEYSEIFKDEYLLGINKDDILRNIKLYQEEYFKIEQYIKSVFEIYNDLSIENKKKFHSFYTNYQELLKVISRLLQQQ